MIHSSHCFPGTLSFVLDWPKSLTWMNFLANPMTVKILKWFSVHFTSAAQLCLTLSDPRNRSRPGLPIHHQLPEFTQTHVHRVSDAIQPSHPLSSPSPPAPSPFQPVPMSQLFTWGDQTIGVSASASVLPVNTQDWSPLGWTGWIS